MKRGWLVLTLTALTGCVDATCDPDAIQAALNRAAPGDVVAIGACRVVADLTVPAGVTLRGQGPDRSTLVGASRAALRVIPGGAEPTRILSLRIESSVCAAVIAEGPGDVEADNLELDVRTGIGIGAEGLDRLSLSTVQVRGPLADGSSPSVVPLPPYTCESADPATHGVIVFEVDDADFASVTSEGFAAFGVLAAESGLRWFEGASRTHIGAGLEVYGGTADLQDVELSGARQDVAPIESFNAVFAGGAVVTSRGLTVADGEVFGLFHQDATATHRALTARDNGFVAVWAQDSPSLTLEDAMLRNNRFASVAAFRVQTVGVLGATVEGTTEGLSLTGSTGAVRAADGVHLVEIGSATLARVTLSENQRVGFLADLAGASTDTLQLTDVTVMGSGTQLGAVAQNGTIQPGWDSTVVRDAITQGNDLAFTGGLGVAGVVGPSCLPSVDSVLRDGLAGFAP